MYADDTTPPAKMRFADGHVTHAMWTQELQEMLRSPGFSAGLREVWLDEGSGWQLIFTRSDEDTEIDFTQRVDG